MSQQILASSGETLRGILLQCRQLQAWQKQIEPLIPEELREHCLVASYRSGCLKFVVSSAVWATRLRYCFPDLLANLRKFPAWHDLKKM